MTNRIHILNGPNLNLLGEREPDIYGVSSLKDIENNLVAFANRNEAEVIFKQTNHEGKLIELIHEAGKNGDGVTFKGFKKCARSLRGCGYLRGHLPPPA